MSRDALHDLALATAQRMAHRLVAKRNGAPEALVSEDELLVTLAAAYEVGFVAAENSRRVRLAP